MKCRVDRLVVERGLAETREKARRLVLAGEVLVDEAPVTKAGALVDVDACVRLRSAPSPFVGRGGEKLAGALEDLGVEVEGLAVLDVGASTGGFTDCLLQKGARHVTALDVGKGQLAWKLRSDPRVRVLEGVNARHLSADDVEGPFDLATMDVSFISLTKVLPAVAGVLREGGKILALVKPQFELSRAEVGAGGIVREPELHAKAVARAVAGAAESGLDEVGHAESRVPGMEGNREFFVLFVLVGRERGAV